MNGKQLINWKDGDWIKGVAVSADGKYIASVHSTPKFSGKLEVRYTDSGKAIFTGETDHSENVVAFSPDGLRILTGTNDGSIESWSRDGSRHTLINRNEDQAKISTIVFSKDGKVYASGDETGVLNIWDAESDKLIKAIGGNDYPSSIRQILASPSGKYILSVDYVNPPKLWDTQTGSFGPQFRRTRHPKTAPQLFQPMRTLVAFSVKNNTIKVYALNSGKLVQTISDPSLF